MSDDAFEQLERTAQKIMALIDHLQAENKKLRADNERLLIDGIHTCHDQCQRVACVLRRERDAALADNEQLRAALTPTINPRIASSFYRDANKYWPGDGLRAEVCDGAAKTAGEDKE